MARNQYRSTGRRGQRHSNPPGGQHSPMLRASGAATQHSATSTGHRTFRNVTITLAAPTDFGFGVFPPRHRTASSAVSLGRQPRQSSPTPPYDWRDVEEPWDPEIIEPRYEATDYGSHDEGEEMSSSMLVSPETPASPSQFEYRIVPDHQYRQITGREPTVHGNERGNAMPSVVSSWSFNPSEILSGQDSIRGDYHGHGASHLDGIVFREPEIAPLYPYPSELADADVHDVGYWVEPGPTHPDNNQAEGVQGERDDEQVTCDADDNTQECRRGW